jgi:deoxyribodipyrimidine photo-lyase
MRLHWHRRDLRTADNRGLSTAADAGVLPVFVFDDAVLAHASPARVAFMLDALAALRADYRETGGDLLLRRGDPATVVPDLVAEAGAAGVTWNADYSGLARERDERVRASLADVETFHDAICHEPGSITTNAGEPYSVYTYFWKKWRDREKDDPYEAPTPEALVSPADAGLDPGALPTLADLGFGDPEADIPLAGTAVARDRLAEFLDGPVLAYADRRDFPADENTSRLSPHLKFGTIGIREVDRAVREKLASVAGAERESVEEFRSQLAWREFYAHVLHFNPEVVTENYLDYDHPIAWREDEAALDAWKAGETGYPIVDAGMRQLRDEAFMHNRVRMLVASFLTKDLLVDWREGYAHFRDLLVDHDTANDTGGWQWAASTGTDAQPYFRVFNPMTQGERYDPDAEYITRYVPELADVPPAKVHSWDDLTARERRDLAPDYPDPIVDHGERRELALSMFRAARGEDADG